MSQTCREFRRVLLATTAIVAPGTIFWSAAP